MKKLVLCLVLVLCCCFCFSFTEESFPFLIPLIPEGEEAEIIEYMNTQGLFFEEKTEEGGLSQYFFSPIDGAKYLYYTNNGVPYLVNTVSVAYMDSCFVVLSVCLFSTGPLDWLEDCLKDLPQYTNSQGTVFYNLAGTGFSFSVIDMPIQGSTTSKLYCKLLNFSDNEINIF